MTEPTPGLRVATYNIHRGVGRDRRTDHQRIADVLLDLDADLIALQEMETPLVAASDSVDLLHQLSEAGYRAVLGPTMRSERNAFGNLLLSRLQVVEHHLYDLSHPGREPRGLIEARLSLDGGAALRAGHPSMAELCCFATHLGLSGRERRKQIGQLAARIGAHQRQDDAGRPTILMGDFNEWRPCSPRLRLIAQRLKPAPVRATFPSILPLLPLDRIWFGGGLQLRRLEVVRDGAARLASDHLPLLASFGLTDGVGGSLSA